MMKNKAILGIIALAAVVGFSMLACDGMFSPNEKATSTGITLNVGGAAPGARALTGPSAEAGTTFYEASFRIGGAGGEIIRTSWNWNTTGKIQIVPGNYEMLLMVGRDDDRTLLGVGRVTHVIDADGTDAPVVAGVAFDILASTASLTIEVEPLYTNVGGAATGVPGDWEPDDSTFKITSDIVASPNSDLLGIVGDKVYQHGTEVPLFHLNGQDNATTNVTATWGFGVGTFGADVGTLSTNKYDVDILVAAANGTVVDANLASADANPVRLESTTYTGPMSPAAIGADGFGMTLEVPDVVGTDGKNGMVKVAIEVPVAAYDLAKGNPQTWYIRGGLNPHLLDPGQFPQQGANSQIAFGGAVVVGFGTLTGIPKVELNPSF